VLDNEQAASYILISQNYKYDISNVKAIMRAVAIIVVFETVLAAIFVVSAGRWDLPWFWTLLAIHATGMTISLLLIDPELRKERLNLRRPGGIDRPLRALLLVFLLSHLAIAALDGGRFGWSGPLAPAVHVLGLIGYCAGFSLALWAMTVNCFFSPVVRLSSERGHHVITTGPYRFVRHPGYLGFIIAMISEAFMLGSYWSLLPLLIALPVIVKRTLLEDRFLHNSLTGYSEYARKVRFRMAPALW